MSRMVDRPETLLVHLLTPEALKKSVGAVTDSDRQQREQPAMHLWVQRAVRLAEAAHRPGALLLRLRAHQEVVVQPQLRVVASGMVLGYPQMGTKITGR